jgi:NADP-dependent 3-hydroxy acid dehydrogenase YdfG
MMTNPLDGKKGIIFGASSGVGAALAQLLNETEKLYAVSRRGCLLDKKQQPISHPSHIVPIACDVRLYQDVERLLAQIPEDIDFIVSSVGVGFYAPFDADYSGAWKDIFDTNVIGNMNIMSCISRLRPSCQQAIVLGSVAAKRPSDTVGNSVYRASKVALATFLSDYRRELRAAGNMMKICNVEPGFIEGTDFGRRFFETNSSKKRDLYQNFKSLQPEDVAPIIKYILCAEKDVDIGEIVLRPTAQPT